MPDNFAPKDFDVFVPPPIPSKIEDQGYPPGGVDPKGDFHFLKCNTNGYVHTVHQDQLDRIEAKLDQLLTPKITTCPNCPPPGFEGIWGGYCPTHGSPCSTCVPLHKTVALLNCKCPCHSR